MTTSRSDLLAGVDMEGGENFCDSIYNFLKNQGKDINLFTNSGFGVWSQSDTNKGLAELVFDNGTVAPVVGETIAGANATGKVAWINVTDDDWAGGNGAGTAYLGAVTGTYIDNETIAGSVAAAFDVNGDTDIGVKNDPCNNDSRGIWTTDAGLNLGFGAALYTVDTNAVNLDAWITAGATLEAGKIYKIELDINDGVVNTKGIQGYFDDGAAQYGRIETTGAGFVSVSWTFECATSTAAGKVGFSIVENLGGAGQNIQIRRFSCYEITPCCTAGDAVTFDGWKKDSTLDLYRQHNDGGTLTKDGSFYSLACVPGAVNDWLDFPVIGVNEEWYRQFAGRPVTFGCWVKTSTTSHARIRITDSVASTYSLYHTGGGAWEWLEVTRVVDSATTEFFTRISFNAAPNVEGDTIVYISQPMLVFGWSLGEGMYQPRHHEVIYFELAVESLNLNALLGQSTIGPFDVNLEADTDAKLPKGAKAIAVFTNISDAGSLGGAPVAIWMRSDAPAGVRYVSEISGIADNATRRQFGQQSLSVNGDFDIRINASGAGDFDLTEFWYKAVQVTN